MQQCISFTLLPSCKFFCTAMNNKTYLRIHVKYPIFCPLLTTFFYFHDTSANIKISRKFAQWGRCCVTPCSPANKTYHYIITSWNFYTSWEGTVDSVHVMKAYSGSGDTVPLNLNIYTSGQPHTPKENSRYPLGGTPGPVGTFVPTCIETSHNPVRSLFTIPTAWTDFSGTSNKGKFKAQIESHFMFCWPCISV